MESNSIRILEEEMDDADADNCHTTALNNM